MSSDLCALAEIYLSVTDRFKDVSPFNSVRTFYHGLVLGDAESKLSFMTDEEMDTLDEMVCGRSVPHYEELIAVTIRSATHATQLVGFYVAYCKHCRKKSFASPFSGIAQFYAGLTFSKNDIGTLKQGLNAHIKADLKAVEAVESPARAHQSSAVKSEYSRRWKQDYLARRAREKEERRLVDAQRALAPE